MRSILVVLLIVSALATACRNKPGPYPVEASWDSVVAQTWTLAFLDGERVSVDAPPTLAFDDARGLSGFAGVNRYFGGYELGQDYGFETGPLGSTRMAGPPELLELESRFLALMDGADGWDAGPESLTFMRRGQPVLVFIPAP